MLESTSRNLGGERPDYPGARKLRKISVWWQLFGGSIGASSSMTRLIDICSAEKRWRVVRQQKKRTMEKVLEFRKFESKYFMLE